MSARAAASETPSFNRPTPVNEYESSPVDGGKGSDIQASTLASGNANGTGITPTTAVAMPFRSEEHTSELQSRENLVCRLLLEKKKKTLYNFLANKKKKKTNK